MVITDGCNTALKLHRILVDALDGAYDLDCWNHMRNVWFGNMEKAITKHTLAAMRDAPVTKA